MVNVPSAQDELPFEVRMHHVPASHVRDSHRGAAKENAELQLEVKQYIPKPAREPEVDDPTFICAGGIGMGKELFQPFFADLTIACRQRGVHPRAFWIADPVYTGGSALLNEEYQSNEMLWFDHSRDLLLMANLFRKELPPPLIGLGHSMGGAVIAHLALIHPNLLHSILLFEPAIYTNSPLNEQTALIRGMLKRRETYPSHQAAIESISKSPFYRKWDPRVRDLIVRHHFTPTNASRQADGPVQYKTSGHIEAALTLKPNLADERVAAEQDISEFSAEQRNALPFFDPEAPSKFPWYRTESIHLLKNLPSLRPSVFYVVAGKKSSSSPEILDIRMRTTGTGVGGSGGAKLGRVAQHIVANGTHFVMFEEECVPDVVKGCSSWLEKEMALWKTSRESDREWFARSAEEKVQFDPILKEAVLDWKPKEDKNVAEIVKDKLSKL